MQRVIFMRTGRNDIVLFIYIKIVIVTAAKGFLHFKIDHFRKF